MGKTVKPKVVAGEWNMDTMEMDDMRCDPIDTVDGLFGFVSGPPAAWASLATPLVPHSSLKINNMTVNERHPISMESPRTFCHFSPEEEEVQLVDEKLLPKTLLCHDMNNGYHDDSYVDGTTNYDAYSFNNWAGIDIFCYFSHHFVTIPPVSWINVAHQHGVQVIGTLITEYADGTAVWKNILSDPQITELTVNALVAIAKTYRFEGWLLNIEHKVTEPEKLLSFVKALHSKLHSEVPNAVLIWYDSVTCEGKLHWQNKLCDKNRQFFDACDGIFTNYSWTEEDVKASAEEAGTRVHDVYVGIDVWGRNFYGGGQFNTQEAVAVARKHGCSIGIFAPAWTHEAITEDHTGSAEMTHNVPSDLTHNAIAGTGPAEMTHTGPSDLTRFQCYLLRERALWGSLWPYLTTRLPIQLPFKTSFCRGFGVKRRFYGEVLSQSPWYNLRHMQYQPNSVHGPHGYLLANEKGLVDVLEHNAKSQQGILKYRASAIDIHRMKTLADDISDDSQDAYKARNSVEIDDDFEKQFKEQLAATVAGIDRSLSIERTSKEEGSSQELQEIQEKTREEEITQSTIVLKQELEKEIVVEKIKQRIIQEQLKEEKEKQREREEELRKKELKRKKALEATKGKDNEVMCECFEDSNLDSIIQVGTISALQPVYKPEMTNPEMIVKPGHSNDTRILTIEERPYIEEFEERKGQNVYQLKSDIHKDDDDSYGVMRRISASRSQRSMVTMSVSLRLGHCTGSGTDTRRLLAAVHSERPCLQLCLSDAFSGGACLTIHPSDMVLTDPRTIRLLFCDFPCDFPLIVCVVTKTVQGHEKQTLNITLSGEGDANNQVKVTLIGRSLPQTDSPSTRVPIDVSSEEFKQLRQYILLNEPSFYVPVENAYGWNVRYYETKPLKCRLRWVSCHTTMPEGPIKLGHVGFCPRK